MLAGVTDPRLVPADLAPGDARALAVDWSGLRLERVDGVDHPWFSRAYERLWHEFGARNEMESRAVIAGRLAAAVRRHRDHALAYELLVVHDGRELVAVRDHTAAVPLAGDDRVVVHLSHALVEPAWRGSGLAGWLRALPLHAARRCAAAVGRRAPAITLAAEMDPPDGVTPAVMTRLRSYARAGFAMVDPAIDYHQPDFREPAAIDATGVQPVPLVLVLRRVGDERRAAISGAELRALIAALYTVYAAQQRPADMDPLWSRLAALPDAPVPLRPPA